MQVIPNKSFKINSLKTFLKKIFTEIIFQCLEDDKSASFKIWWLMLNGVSRSATEFNTTGPEAKSIILTFSISFNFEKSSVCSIFLDRI